jgi:hypothetical protein
MILSKARAATLAVGLAALALASPSQARGRYDPDGHYIISAARAAAIHECTQRAAQWGPEYEMGTMPIYQYRACMAEHGQQE